jgi:competence ComEA-like helix-hairpin-helix protein
MKQWSNYFFMNTLSRGWSQKIKITLLVGIACFMAIFYFLPVIQAAEKININTADSTALDSLPGIGPAKAEDIIAYRTSNGPFQKIEDLMNVAGIGQTTFDGLQDQICVSATDCGNDVDDGAGDGINSATYVDQIFINEILPNPAGSDDNEWVEIFNSSSGEADLSNWKLVDADDHSFILPTGTKIAANGFLIFSDLGTVSLNNNGDTIKLFQPDNNLLHQTNYSAGAEDNYCWARNDVGEFVWTTTCTENTTNIITAPPPPAASGGGSNSFTETESQTTSDSSSTSKSSSSSGYQNKILITEILPNPLGVDNDEWLELYNTTTEEYFLDNWKLKDNQTEYIIKNIKLPAKSFLLLSKKETKFVLNNGGDLVELFDLDNKSVARAEYKTTAPENQSYNFCYQKWLWLAPTPGAVNPCPPPNKLPNAFFEPTTEDFVVGQEILLDATESFDTDGQLMKYTWQFSQVVEEIDSQKQAKIFETTAPVFKFKFLSGGKQKISLIVTDNLSGEDKFSLDLMVAGNTQEAAEIKKFNSTNKTAGSYFIPIALAEARELEKNSKVLVEGIVSVAPGVLGADQFYLAGSGVQIYFSQKDFPNLVVGDKVRVRGTLTSYYNETRIKVAQRADIIFLQSGPAPEPQEINLDEIGEDYEGSLVRVSGEVTEIKNDSFWLDDGSVEARVYLKKTANIDLNKIDLKVGSQLTLTAIVSETTAGYRLLPRSADDFLVGQVSGAATSANTKTRWPYYLLAALLAIALVTAAILWKNKKEKQMSDEEIFKF